MSLLGQSHGPADDRGPRRDHRCSGLLELCGGESGCLDDGFEVDGADTFGPRLESCAGGVAEFADEDAARVSVFFVEQQFRHALEQCLVAFDAYLEEFVGDGHGVTDDGVDFLRVFESHQPGFGEWVDGSYFGTVRFRLLQCRKHAGVVGAGFVRR